MRSLWYIEKRRSESWRAISELFGEWLDQNAGPDVLQSFGWSEGVSVSLENPPLKFVCFSFPEHHGPTKIGLIETWAKSTDRVYGYWEDGSIHFSSANLPPHPHQLEQGMTWPPPWLKRDAGRPT